MTKIENYVDLSQFDKRREIGEGSFGKVYEIIEKKSGKLLTAKISLNTMDENSRESLLNHYREVDINYGMNHPAIIQFIGFNPTNFQKENKPVVISKLSVNGSFSSIIEYENRGLSVPN